MFDALIREMELRKDYLDGQSLETIYLGGGTPSLLTQKELEQLFEKIYQLFSVSTAPEITLEANPDDLSLEKLKELRNTAVNRLSIGVQSFSEGDLRFMNRAHNANEAKACIQNAQDVGFDNLTVDLIYGTPTTSDEIWEKNMQTLFDFSIPHISSYCLTVEPKTALEHFVQTGKAKPVDEEQASRQFNMLMQAMEVNGYDHYEISNFAKPGWYARHNSSYWQGKSYLGLGPSAHSYNGKSRQWNIANNARYIKMLQAAHDYQDLENTTAPLFEVEHLNADQIYNEYVMTGLRTIWGCDLSKIRAIGPRYEKHFLRYVVPSLQQGLIFREENFFRLTKKGKLLADHLAVELFV